MSIHERLLTARRGQRRADFQLAVLLAEMATHRLFAQLGYSSLSNYADVVLELSPRSARELVALGRRLPDLPHISARLEVGDLDWTKARELVRVVTPETEEAWVASPEGPLLAHARSGPSNRAGHGSAKAYPAKPLTSQSKREQRQIVENDGATPEKQPVRARQRQNWLERAATVSCRVLEVEVANASVGEPPPEGQPEPLRRLDRQRLVFEMEAADAEVVRTAIAATRAVTHVGEEISDGAILAALVRSGLVVTEQAAEGSAPTGERYRVVIEHCPGCSRTVSPDAEVSDTVVTEALCDAEILDMRPGPGQGHVTRAVPEVTGRKVFSRACWKCEVPECGNRLWLDIHHMQPRALGGRHGLENLASVCCIHHRCIHDGTLAVELVGDVADRVIEVRYADGRTSRARRRG